MQTCFTTFRSLRAVLIGAAPQAGRPSLPRQERGHEGCHPSHFPASVPPLDDGSALVPVYHRQAPRHRLTDGRGFARWKTGTRAVRTRR